MEELGKEVFNITINLKEFNHGKENKNNSA